MISDSVHFSPRQLHALNTHKIMLEDILKATADSLIKVICPASLWPQGFPQKLSCAFRAPTSSLQYMSHYTLQFSQERDLYFYSFFTHKLKLVHTCKLAYTLKCWKLYLKVYQSPGTYLQHILDYKSPEPYHSYTFLISNLNYMEIQG